MEGSGSLPDGAFERFVTSALAAIITIVFSWRLLAEGQDQLEGASRPRPPRFREIDQERDIKDKSEQPPIDIPIDENIQQTESETLASVPKYATLETTSDTKQDEVDSAPSWGDYSWEEDMYDTVHTRRHVQDFVVKRSSESSDDQEMESDIQLSPIPASHEMLEKLYMNQEYRSIVDDGEESDSSESDGSVEGVYETETVEQNMDMYYASGLEPIMEEDSDDMDSSENETDNDEHYDSKKQDVVECENTTDKMTSDNEPEGTSQDLVEHEKVKHQTDINASLNDSDDTSSLPELADDNKSLLDNFIEECFDKCNDDSDNSDDTDSLPPSPIFRTRAIDDEVENLSDESCSSESVVTVLSVKSDYSDTPEIQIVEDSNRPLSFIFTDNESNTPDNLKEKDILAFIHGSQERIDLNKTPDNEIDDELVIDGIKNSSNENQLDYEDFIKDIQAASEINIAAENSKDNEKSNGNSDANVQNEENDIISQQKCVENELLIQESTECLHESIPKCENQKMDNISSNQFSKISDDIENRFDDDVGPREYNPYDDDFAEFGYCDSDDDSFFFVVGESNNIPNYSTFNNADSGHLRNFDTFDNLNAVGLSPGHDSSCESGMSDDGRFIFSRTENISTEYRSRFYVKDRDTVPTNNLDTQQTEEVLEPEVDLQVENKNSYNESKFKITESSDPVISDLENIELFIDESKISENSSPPSRIIDSETKDIEQSEKFIDTDAASPDINYSSAKEQDNTIKNISISEVKPLIVEKTDINGNSTDDELHSSTGKRNKEIPIEISEKLINNVECKELQTKTPVQNNDIAKSKSEMNSLNIYDNGQIETSLKPCIEILSRAHDSGIDLDAESSKLDSSDDSAASPVHKYEILDLLHAVKGQIDRSSTVKPSLFHSNTKSKVQHHKQKQRSKSYVSVLQQPMAPESTRSVAVVLPDKAVPKSRQQINASRKRFLSEENLLSDGMQDKFQQHKTSFEHTTHRKPRYVRRGNSLPRTRTHKSYDKLDFNSLNSSRSSVEKPEICTLHDNCIFSPHKHQEILDRTLSIENLESTLMRYGSVASLVETDIDSGETTEYQIFTDFDNDFQFQLPLERTASMNELATRKKNKTESKGRFSDRNVPKSKSLCTLETDIDDIDEAAPRPGTLGRVPSVHELRVTKSLQKLNVPDWYKKSSVSRSGSTWSLYSSPRKDSISSYNYSPSITSSPCPSVSATSNSVVIRTRISPSTARLFRSPKLQTTPEKSPTPISVQLPSEKLRQKEKPKELMPIPIVPFTKLRLMFEESSRKLKPLSLSSKPPPPSPVASPTTPVSPTEHVAQIEQHVAHVEQHVAHVEPTQSVAKPTTKPVVPAKPILKKSTASVSETKNVGRVEPQKATPLSVQPMSTSPRSGRRVETTFNGSVGQSEVRKAKETTFDGEKPVQVVKPEKQEQNINPQISKTTENQNEHNSKSARYSSLSKSLKSAFRRPQKSATVETGGSKIETVV